VQQVDANDQASSDDDKDSDNEKWETTSRQCSEGTEEQAVFFPYLDPGTQTEQRQENGDKKDKNAHDDRENDVPPEQESGSAHKKRNPVCVPEEMCQYCPYQHQDDNQSPSSFSVAAFWSY